MSELQDVQNKILATEERLAIAEAKNERELVLECIRYLKELQIKENRLSAPAIGAGKPKLYLIACLNLIMTVSMVKNIFNCYFFILFALWN